MITVTELNIYPIKSLRGVSVESSTVTTKGLRFDREWMVIDHRNYFVTQRDLPMMATIDVSVSEESNRLYLKHPSMPDISLDLNSSSGERLEVKIWKDHTQAYDQGDAVSQWLTEALGPHRDGRLRLVRFDSAFKRKVEPKYLNDDDADVQFADGYPYLICLEETLTQLNQSLTQPVPMNRFRGNIIISGLRALQEHDTPELRAPSGALRFGLRKPCQRCKVTTTDQRTGEVSEQREPLRTLVTQNPFDDLLGGYFGQNAILLDGDGLKISVGDALV